jgi:3-methyladenine DNA glycosylase AlkC
MMKVTAKPAGQWSSNATPSLSRMSSGIARISSPLQHSLLPRSIDVSFSLRYRR